MTKQNVSLSVIRRMPRYYRFLEALKDSGIVRISSKELAARMGLTASQIRQDFNCFGGFGQQGYGYNVPELYEAIGKIIGINAPKGVILLGLGNLGQTIAANINFPSMGFELLGIFDISAEKTGRRFAGVGVYHTDELAEFCRKYSPEAAFLCLPSEVAPRTLDELVALGINSFWNFSHCDLTVSHPGIVAENVHLGDSLMTLRFRMG